jgi:hypothetical protein
MLDHEFQGTRSYFAHLVQQLTEHDVVQPFSFSAIKRIVQTVLDSSDLFCEASSNLFDLMRLKGFAARWNVLVVVYVPLRQLKLKAETN